MEYAGGVPLPPLSPWLLGLSPQARGWSASYCGCGDVLDSGMTETLSGRYHKVKEEVMALEAERDRASASAESCAHRSRRLSSRLQSLQDYALNQVSQGDEAGARGTLRIKLAVHDAWMKNIARAQANLNLVEKLEQVISWKQADLLWALKEMKEEQMSPRAQQEGLASDSGEVDEVASTDEVHSWRSPSLHTVSSWDAVRTGDEELGGALAKEMSRGEEDHAGAVQERPPTELPSDTPRGEFDREESSPLEPGDGDPPGPTTGVAGPAADEGGQDVAKAEVESAPMTDIDDKIDVTGGDAAALVTEQAEAPVSSFASTPDSNGESEVAETLEDLIKRAHEEGYVVKEEEVEAVLNRLKHVVERGALVRQGDE